MSQIPKLEFYRFDGACSIVAHALLRELDIPFETVIVKMGGDGTEAADGSFTAQQYRKIQHQGYVPGLTIDGKPLTELAAIITYIVSLSAQGRALTGGEDPVERAEVVSWTTWLSGTMHSYGGGFGLLFRPVRFVDDEKLYAGVQEKGRALIRKNCQRINEHLADREFLVGKADTIADYNLIVFWYWGEKYGFDMATNYPNYGKLIKRMEGKKGVREVLLKEGFPLSFA